MRTTWIPITSEVWNDVQVRRLAGLLQTEIDVVVAKLCRLWVWVADSSGHRHVTGLDERTINGLVDFDGFAEAMLKVHLLTPTERGLVVPQFEARFCPASKARLGDAVRKSIARRRGRGGEPEDDGPPWPAGFAAEADAGVPGEAPADTHAREASRNDGGRSDARPDECPDKRPDTCPDKSPDKSPDARPNCRDRAATSKEPEDELICSGNACMHPRVAADAERGEGAARAGKPAALSRFQMEVCSLLLKQVHKGELLYAKSAAAAISRNPRATLEQATWALERLKTEIPTGRIRNPAGYLRDLILKEDPPRSWIEHNRRTKLAELARLHTRVQETLTTSQKPDPWKGEGGVISPQFFEGTARGSAVCALTGFA